MSKSLILIGFGLIFSSVSACAQNYEITKKKCSVGDESTTLKNIVIDGSVFSLGIDRLNIQNINIFNKTLNVILMSDMEEVVFISIKPSDQDLLLDARRIALQSPLGKLSKIDELYGPSPFGMGVNTVFESDAYGSFLVVETGADSRTIRLIGSGKSKDYVVEFSITPALPCNKINIFNMSSDENYENETVRELNSLISGFVDDNDIKLDMERLKGKTL